MASTEVIRNTISRVVNKAIVLGYQLKGYSDTGDSLVILLCREVANEKHFIMASLKQFFCWSQTKDEYGEDCVINELSIRHENVCLEALEAFKIYDKESYDHWNLKQGRMFYWGEVYTKGA